MYIWSTLQISSFGISTTSPTFILPSNSKITPEKTSPNMDCNPKPIPTNKAAEPAIRKVILIPKPCIAITKAMV